VPYLVMPGTAPMSDETAWSGTPRTNIAVAFVYRNRWNPRPRPSRKILFRNAQDRYETRYETRPRTKGTAPSPRH
jgi:hypothetical protein